VIEIAKHVKNKRWRFKMEKTEKRNKEREVRKTKNKQES
jgi:hypothetical protein